MNDRPDDGYAILAAVAAIAVFALFAFQIMASAQGQIAGLTGQMQQARMTAAAQAGEAMAIRGLAIEDPARRWPLDGRPQTFSFDGWRVAVTVQDERGKVPLGRLDEDQTRRLFELAGASEEQLNGLVDAYQDWIDSDDDRRVNGAEAPDYRALGYAPRNGPMRTLDEMADIKGMTPQLLARIKPMAAAFFGGGGAFDPTTASPQAIAVMLQQGADSPQAIEAQRELDGQRTALAIPSTQTLTGRPLTIRVAVSGADGDQLQRASVVELTGARDHPYQVRLAY